ncbi:hypothetical protein Ga0080574_TMP1312 [Salipiger abyssi]|uniref:Uncharacterized protein n=1 Tax=Salipiger abyssi TaxID=1250539 RepID=A0A1P8UQI2_9RHOB|nr:hypothetical protein Ga0080574_TMP1312 [Salipiger abyssi]
MAQAFVEIGAILLRYVVDPRCGDLHPGAFGERVEIADHRVRHDARAQQGRRAAIRRDAGLALRQQRLQQFRAVIAASGEQYRAVTVMSCVIHVNLMAIWETDHNAVTK